MSTIVKEVIIPNNHHIKLDIELPTTLPPGEALVTLIIEPKSDTAGNNNFLDELFGKGKNEMWISKDFDAPLADFEEYM